MTAVHEHVFERRYTWTPVHLESGGTVYWQMPDGVGRMCACGEREPFKSSPEESAKAARDFLLGGRPTSSHVLSR